MKKFISYEISAFLILVMGLCIYLLDLHNYNIFPMIRNYVPDFLWGLSFFLALVPIVEQIFPKKYLVVVAIICSFCGISFEILQWLKFVKGTADFWDAIMYIIATIFGSCIIKLFKKGKRI